MANVPKGMPSCQVIKLERVERPVVQVLGKEYEERKCLKRQQQQQLKKKNAENNKTTEETSGANTN